MTAIPPSERGKHIAAISTVFNAVASIREIPDGYAFELPNETAVLARAGTFITLERR